MRRAAVSVVPMLVLLAGCSAGGGSADSGGSAALAQPAADGGAKAAPDVQVQQAAGQPVAVPRSLIRTAELLVRVGNVKQAAADAERLVQEAGGEVSAENLDLDAGNPSASLDLQVPPARLSATLSRLSALGDEQSRRLGSEDVTDQVVDLDSRLATQRASVARVRALLERATALGDVVRLEGELSRREADLESLQARARALSGQVDMAKVTLRLSTKAAPVLATDVGFTSGLRGGWHAFLAAARVAGATVGALLPFLPLVLLAGWAALWWRRRTSPTRPGTA